MSCSKEKPSPDRTMRRGETGPSAYEYWVTQQPAGSDTSADAYLNSMKGAASSDLVGPKGETGAAGPRGQKGPTGDTGAAGKNGAKGATGDKGPTGDTGPVGDTGAAGQNGSKGPTGDTGPQGPKGPEGAQGAQGATGPAGPDGENGGKGMTGDTGPKGITGDTGAKGETGDQGLRGPTGPQGVAGEQGPVGAQGKQGAQGLQGPKGTDAKNYAMQASFTSSNLSFGYPDRETGPACGYIGPNFYMRIVIGLYRVEKGLLNEPVYAYFTVAPCDENGVLTPFTIQILSVDPPNQTGYTEATILFVFSGKPTHRVELGTGTVSALQMAYNTQFTGATHIPRAPQGGIANELRILSGYLYTNPI